MTKAEIRKEIQRLSKNVDIKIMPATPAPKQLTAFVRLSLTNRTGCRVDGARLGGGQGRCK